MSVNMNTLMNIYVDEVKSETTFRRRRFFLGKT